MFFNIANSLINVPNTELGSRLRRVMCLIQLYSAYFRDWTSHDTTFKLSFIPSNLYTLHTPDNNIWRCIAIKHFWQQNPSHLSLLLIHPSSVWKECVLHQRETSPEGKWISQNRSCLPHRLGVIIAHISTSRKSAWIQNKLIIHRHEAQEDRTTRAKPPHIYRTRLCWFSSHWAAFFLASVFTSMCILITLNAKPQWSSEIGARFRGPGHNAL